MSVAAAGADWEPPALLALTRPCPAQLERRAAAALACRLAAEPAGGALLLRWPEADAVTLERGWSELTALVAEAAPDLTLGLALARPDAALFALARRLRPRWLHLSTAARGHLAAPQRRALAPGAWLSTAAHGAAEAGALEGFDALLVSPVRATPSKPGALALELGGLAAAVAATPARVYALGGMTAADLALVRGLGAAGVAMMEGAWAAPTRARPVG